MINAFPTAALPFLPLPTAKGGSQHNRPGKKPRTLLAICSEEEEEESTVLSLKEWSNRSNNMIFQKRIITVLRSDAVTAPHFSSSVTQ